MATQHVSLCEDTSDAPRTSSRCDWRFTDLGNSFNTEQLTEKEVMTFYRLPPLLHKKGTTMTTNDKKELEFLEAYKELCLEHGFQIIGCGDCGSAWLTALTKEEFKNKTLCWKTDEKKEIYFATDYELAEAKENEDLRFL